MNGYDLSRKWFDFSFENKEAKVQHTAIYMWCIELNNRLGWKKEFGLPTIDTMEGLSIGNKNTFLSALSDLVGWGFLTIIKEPKNQCQSRIISLCCVESATALVSALDTALIQQSVQQSDSIGVGTDPIDKPETSKPITKKPQTKDIEAKPPRPRHEYHDIWDEWFRKNFGVTYAMKAKDWVGLDLIKKFCDENGRCDPKIDSWKALLARFGNLPPYYQENRNPSFIGNKISEIVALIVKPVSSKQGQENLVTMFNNTKDTEGIDLTQFIDK